MPRLALPMLAALLLATSAQAQESTAAAAPSAPMAGHAHAMAPGVSVGGGCASMVARMDSANARIALLTHAMNTATGTKKTEAMAAVLNAVVQDRLAMQSMMQEMHSHMGMMGDMGGMGATSACSGGMECCKGGSTSCGAHASAPEKQE